MPRRRLVATGRTPTPVVVVASRPKDRQDKLYIYMPLLPQIIFFYGNVMAHAIILKCVRNVAKGCEGLVLARATIRKMNFMYNVKASSFLEVLVGQRNK